jgi:hypothetical protein
MKVATTTKKPPTRAASTNVTKKAPQKRAVVDVILETVAEAYSISFGKVPLERKRLEIVTGLKKKTIDNTLPQLGRNGWITYDSKTLQLTAEGVKKVGSLVSFPQNNAECQARIKQNLKGKAIELLELLEDGRAHNCGDVAVKLGYDSAKKKSFANLKGSLKGKGFAEYSSDKQSIQLSDVCFPFGRFNP